ncbi:MAG: flagellar hook-associated protein FlgL [Zetaproteobacteria bacterium]|nr:flagellar hook-associated protein FlgL [Zetaproteobacteria bacterium]
MRVSERHRYWVANNRIGKARRDQVDTLNTLSTQKRINTLADDPIGNVKSLQLKKKLSHLGDLQKNIDFSKGFLDVTESALNEISDRMIRAQELAIAMANDTYDGKNREITSKEVRQLIQQVIQLANSRYGNKYVFSGFRHSAPAMDLHGNFVGDDGEIFVQLGHSQFKKINIPGRALFVANAKEQDQGHFGLISSLDLLLSGMENNDKDALYRAVDEISHQMDKISSFQSSLGATWAAVNAAQKRTEFREVQAATFLSKVEDADIFQSTSDFKRAESVLQSTLMASNKLLQPSLLNFLS